MKLLAQIRIIKFHSQHFLAIQSDEPSIYFSCDAMPLTYGKYINIMFHE